MGELGIVDVWRERHPTSKDYTHYSFPHSVYSSLEYFFVFSSDKFQIRGCNIATTDLSDHSPISMTLALERKGRKTLWKLNSYILNDLNVLEGLKEDIRHYPDLNDSGEVSPAVGHTESSNEGENYLHYFTYEETQRTKVNRSTD